MESISKHSVTLHARKRAVIEGVEKVVDSSAVIINIITSDGALTIRGSELKILSFSVTGGTLSFEGTIDKLEYSVKKKPLLRRIFK